MAKTYFSAALLALAGVLNLALPQQALAASPRTASDNAVSPVNGMLGNVNFNYSFPTVSGSAVILASGTLAYAANLTVDGTARTYVVIRPVAAPTTPPPLLVLLHPLGTSPVAMANLTFVSNYVAAEGFWVVLPAAINGQWDDDIVGSPHTDTDFISSLIDTMVAQGVDATRVYAAGYSDGGFMSERLACELSEKIAAFGIDAGTLIGDTPANCAPAVQRPKLYIYGTSDPLVQYNGLPGLDSAAATMAYWNGLQQCGSIANSTLPTLVNDGTTVTLADYTQCAAGSELRLYTVQNGGHAWPDGLTQLIGKTTQNLNATGIIWSFASQYHL